MFDLTREHAQSIVQAVTPGYHLVSVRPAFGSFTNDARVLECLTPSGTRVCLVVKFLTDEPDEATRCAVASFHALQLARRHGVPVPEPVYLDETGDVLGVPGIVTRLVEGRQVANPRDPVQWAKVLAQILLKIHAIRPGDQDYKYLFNGHDEGLHMLRDDWSKKKASHPLSTEILGTLSELQPAIVAGPSVLIHMDYWYGNVLWHRGRVSAVLDWDFASYGEPAIDIAYFRMNQYLRGTKSAADVFLKSYEEGSGAPVRDLGFWELAAAARPLPIPELWVGATRELGDATVTDERAKADYYEFVAAARQRAYSGR